MHAVEPILRVLEKVVPIVGSGRKRSLALERSQRDREVVRRTAELLAADVPLRTIFSQFCTLLANFVDASRVFIALQEAGSLRIVYVLDEGAAGEAVQREVPPDSHTAEVLRTGKTILKRRRSDWEEGRRATTAVSGAQTQAAEVVAAIYVPLKFGREVIGILSVQSSRADAYAQADAELLETCALYLAVRVHDAGEASAKREFEDLAAVDAMSGVANRRAFDEGLRRRWEGCGVDRSPLSMLLVDVDFFKAFNDIYGHVAGDACLQQVARALEACLNAPGALLARYGGEEFAAIMPDCEPATAISLGEQMCAAIAALGIPHDGSTLGVVSISVGSATLVPSDGDPTELVQVADRALYAAKGAGRNRVAGAHYLSTAPPAERHVEARHNLPLQLTPFLGRQRELADVVEALGEHRLVTLAGPGGIGKTRLAIESALLVVEEFPDGVWFVDLAGVTDPARVEHAIAAVLEWELAGTNALGSLTGLLRPKSALIVLDNCEHVIAACAKVVDAVLRNAPHAKVLATSREPLGIAGEKLYRVLSLAVPPPDHVVNAASAEAYDALLFFASRARAVGYELDDANAPAVAQICRRLDGIPLALELAAARLRSMSIEGLATRLDDRFRTLTGGSRTALPRQQTLRALIDWSYNLLDERERSLFLRLSVFAGSWTTEAAEAVCSGGVIAPGDVDELLGALVEKSLVLHETQAGDTRYRFMESMREYARERLGVEAVVWRSRHAAYVLELADRAERASRAQPTRLWLPAFIPEDDNFAAALEWCLDEAQDPATGAAIAAALLPYWEATSRSPASALRWFERALAFERLLPARLVAHLCLAATFFLRQASIEPERALALADRALEIARSEGDPRLIALAFLNAGGAHLTRIDLEAAQPLFEEALAISRTLGDRLLEADALNCLGMCEDYRGDLAASQPHYNEALVLARAQGHDRKIARALHNLSAIAQDLGELDTALQYEREAVAILERYGTPRAFLVDLADLHLIRGDVETAYSICRDIVEGLVAGRELWMVRECLFVFAQVHYRRGHAPRAARLLGFTSTLEQELAPRQPTIEELYRKFVGSVAEAMSADAYAGAFAEGTLFTLTDAIAEANLPL
jgi:diguanylate cyclase (GGDEF)-like protein